MIAGAAVWHHGRVPRLSVLEYVRHPDGVWNLPASCVERLRAEFPDVEFTSARDRGEADRLLPGCEVVLGWAVTRENFAAAARLDWIQLTAAGVGSQLFPELVESRVRITNGRGLYGVPMAEHALGLMLAFARKLHRARDAQRERRWDPAALARESPPFGVLEGATLGLVGLGSVGTEIARRARALGMRVLAVRRRPRPDPEPADVQWGVEELPRLLEAADVLVLAAPLTERTRGLIGAAELARMRPHALLVNLGRGALVDERALVDALRAGRPAGAALDVLEEEPLPASSPLWDLPSTYVSSHCSTSVDRYVDDLFELFQENVRRYVAGEPLRNAIDMNALGYART